MKPERFESEAHLCDVFATDCRARGYRIYPEHEAGWDLVVVAPDGTITGVEAKMRGTCEAIYQAWDRSRRRAQWDAEHLPHHAATLVPAPLPTGFPEVAHQLGIGAIAYRVDGIKLASERGTYDRWSAGHDWERVEDQLRLGERMSGGIWLPPVEGGVAAGVANPLRVTQWKIRAIRLCLRLRRVGHLTTLDFRELGVDIRRWVAHDRWLRRDGDVVVGGKRVARYVAGTAKLFDETHPELAAALAAEESR